MAKRIEAISSIIITIIAIVMTSSLSVKPELLIYVIATVPALIVSAILIDSTARLSSFESRISNLERDLQII